MDALHILSVRKIIADSQVIISMWLSLNTYSFKEEKKSALLRTANNITTFGFMFSDEECFLTLLDMAPKGSLVVR